MQSAKQSKDIISPAQRAAIERFSHQRVGSLFMEMGTGKTKTALELANLQSDHYDVVLWLGPVSTIENTKDEIEKQGGFSRPAIYCGYESIASSDRIYLDLLDKLNGKRLFMICDESLYLKNGNTKRWQRSNRIRKDYADFCILLNGTPMSRDEMDIYWQMEFLSPLIFDMSEHEFRSTMFIKVKECKNGNKRMFFKRCAINIPWLKSKIEPYVYECDLRLNCELSVYTKLPRVTEYTTAKYNILKNELLIAVRAFDEFSIMATLSKMKHLVACDRLKNDMIAGYITDKHVVVFCEYLEEMDRIVSMTKNGVFAINGDTPIKKRHKIITEWENTNKPLVVMSACGAFGLNLQSSNEVVFASLPWDYALYSQAIHRVYRRGQKSANVTITEYIQRIGIMRMVEDCLWKKETLAQFVRNTDWTKYIGEEVKNGQ